ncbi:MAG: hypothetical protein V2I66_13105 [Halieaceae bacterium]|jgi:hypothetical protein|nr:hypothetical protein [Halieaceae bacterium]
MSSYGRKSPRDFVQVDELWEADGQWSSYFIRRQVWVFADEYRAELPGDQDYSRILIHAGPDSAWQYRRKLAEKQEVARVLAAIREPVSQQQLSDLGFSPWDGDYFFATAPDSSTKKD